MIGRLKGTAVMVATLIVAAVATWLWSNHSAGGLDTVPLPDGEGPIPPTTGQLEIRDSPPGSESGSGRVAIDSLRQPQLLTLVFPDPKTAPDTVEATCAGAKVTAARIDNASWRIQCAPSRLSQLVVEAKLAPTMTVLIHDISETRVVVQLPPQRANEVMCLGLTAGRWMCSVTPESTGGDRRPVVEHGGFFLRGAKCKIHMTCADMSSVAGVPITFPSLEGQKWTVYARCPGYALKENSINHQATPSVTKFEVLKKLSSIIVNGDMPDGTYVLLFERQRPGNMVRSVVVARGRTTQIHRTNRGGSIKPDTHYIIRCILPDGVMYRFAFVTDASGSAQVEGMGGDAGCQPWKLRVPSDGIDRLFVSAEGKWLQVPQLPQHLMAVSDTNGAAWWRHSGQETAIMTWSGELWSEGIVLMQNARFARFARGPSRKVSIEWSGAKEGAVDVGQVVRTEGSVFEQGVYWEYSVAATRPIGQTKEAYWIRIDSGHGELEKLAKKAFVVYDDETHTRLRIKPKGKQDMLDITYALSTALSGSQRRR